MAREDLTDRLMSRAGGLSRRNFGGIDVFSGDLGDRALEALNARAFTMDRQIFVARGFDPERNAEDASLLTHEDEHRRRSGGEGGGSAGHSDAEEQDARGVEAMTLHMMESGASLEEVIREVRSGSSSASSATGFSSPAELVSRLLIGGDRDRDPMAAYIQMRSEGTSHAQIVDDLKRDVMDALDRLNAEHSARTGENDFSR
jgi:hypothetical protein